MDEPTTGSTVDEVASKILENMESPVTEESTNEKELSEKPELTPSELHDFTNETDEEAETEEVAEATEETVVEAAEPELDETESFIQDLNNWMQDKERFSEIRVPTKVNGVEGEVSLEEALASYQIKEASEERLNTLKAEKAEFEQKKAQELETFNKQLTQASELVNLLEQQFMADTKNVDWNELRETDPAEYSAKRQDFIEKQQQLQNAKSTIQLEQQAKVMEQYQQLIQRETSALMETFPTWADEAIATQEKSAIREYLIGSGFKPAEIDGSSDENGNILSPGIIDHRAIALARKAMLYDKGEHQVDVTKKKVRKLPKVARPGKPKGNDDLEVEKQKKLRGRLRKTGKVDDAAAVIFDKMFGG